MRPQKLGQRHALTSAVTAMPGLASGLSRSRSSTTSAQRQIKIIKKYSTLVAVPEPPPTPFPTLLYPLFGSEKRPPSHATRTGMSFLWASFEVFLI